jgi:uncharacterized protein involved in exopolysaccharide biosynthesis
MASDQPEDLSFAAAMTFLRAHRRLVLGTGLLVFVVVTTVSLLGSRTFTSTASFMPQTSESVLSRFSGLAATFNLPVPASDPGSSPAFYVTLLKSRDVLRRAVETPYLIHVGGDTVRRTLVEFYQAEGATPPARRDAAAERLLEDLMVSTERETGIVKLEVRTIDPGLSEQVSQRMIGLVSEFNMQRRQSNAGSERRFVEGRSAEAKRALEAAEGRLQGFLQRNREYRNAPQLMFEYDRLQRDVQMQQQLYSTLAQALEQSRIDEVRNTPVITLIEPPDLPAKPDGRFALVKGILGLLVGLGLGALFAVWRQLLAGMGPVRSPSVAEGEGRTGPGLARNLRDTASSESGFGARRSG